MHIHDEKERYWCQAFAQHNNSLYPINFELKAQSDYGIAWPNLHKQKLLPSKANLGKVWANTALESGSFTTRRRRRRGRSEIPQVGSKLQYCCRLLSFAGEWEKSDEKQKKAKETEERWKRRRRKWEFLPNYTNPL